MNKLEQRLSQVLTTRAADAPSPGSLVEAARSRHHRRRRSQTGVVALAVAAAVVVPVGIHSLGVDHESTPEPLGPYKYGQHLKLSDAVPAARAPGFHVLDYGVPSDNPPLPLASGETLGPAAEYLDIDASGRLTDLYLHGRAPTASYRLVPGPGRPARPISDPVGGSIEYGIWQATFTPDGRLLWSKETGQWIHLWTTDVDGANARRVAPSESQVGVPSGVAGQPWRDLWVDNGRVWFSAITKVVGHGNHQQQWVSLFSYDPAHPGQLRREAAADVSVIDVANGEAVWVDASDTKVYAEDLASRQVHQVPVSLDAGCRMVPLSWLSGGGARGTLVTNGSLIALTEFCPDWRTTRVVVTDLSGRLVADFDAGSGRQIYNVVLSDQTIGFIDQPPSGEHDSYLADLMTGELIDLGRQVPDYENPPHVAGRYVIWYAGRGGHVGRLDASSGGS
ncbi:MAG TPA: hypothetical protein VHW64_01980 [Nocardioides sp.]|jgi:hypothetical protein|uniref:hypothetical protein n=1 Tax=Nocardioides sp. TaxID=35761 RepID=UPI002E37E3DA|nr:hypothetical protein [Nocardioides sp.]HEX3929444.1 hypothetical protein [Nocardioides sp.]